MYRIAIVSVCYNRVDSIKRLLDSLLRANYPDDNVSLIISVDKSNTTIVEEYAESFIWPFGAKFVDKHDKNLGLRQHMMSLGKWFEKFDALIVLEDDILVAPDFYMYAKQAVSKYSHTKDIAGISLYNFSINYITGNPFIPVYEGYDAYFMQIAMSWGQVWMKDSWQEFYKWYRDNLDFMPSYNLPKAICTWGEKSWLKYHDRYCIEQGKYFVYPYHSLTTNCGDAGTHAKYNNNMMQVPLSLTKDKIYRMPEFCASSAIYDGFYENESLYKILGYNKSELTIDINTSKRYKKKRFWLTTAHENYKIIKSFGINFRPIELNVLFGSEGTGIFLYDTTQFQKNKFNRINYNLLYYRYLEEVSIFLKHYGLRNVIKDFVVAFWKYKIKK